MSYFIKNGNTWRVTDKSALDIRESLNMGNYVLKFAPEMGFYLEEVDSFTLPPKIYGDLPKYAKRILNTFNSRSTSTGVMLSGEKGSGKTMLARLLSIDGVNEYKMPTIIINTNFTGDTFSKFLQDIDIDCVILFDEFEKIYNSEDQEKILTLLDGVFTQKKLFVFTCNDKWRIDKHMRNRPGRIYYMIEFAGLDVDFVREYCEDNLLNKNEIESVVRLVSVFPEFNFDMLKAIVEEMNRYDEPARDVMKFINARPEYAQTVTYDFVITYAGHTLPREAYYQPKWEGNPLLKEFSITLRKRYVKQMQATVTESDDVDDFWKMSVGGPAIDDEDDYAEDDNRDWYNFTFNPSDIVDITGNTCIYKNKYGFDLSLVRRKTVTYEPTDLLY